MRNEEIVPADSILIRGSALRDNSFITGETRLRSRKVGERIYAGGRQRGEIIEIEVVKNIEQSRLTRLWRNQVFKTSKVYLDNLGNTWSYYFTLAVLGIAAGTGIYWDYTNPENMFQSVCTVLIVACPCALAISTPFTLGNIMRILFM
ncbi:MAG: hypothetical protein ACFIN5_00040 [Candidatus Walczuchella monophlebidarum]